MGKGFQCNSKAKNVVAYGADRAGEEQRLESRRRMSDDRRQKKDRTGRRESKHQISLLIFNSYTFY